MPRLVERERGYTNQQTRARHFKHNPLCAHCLERGVVREWTQLDHIVALVNGGTNDDSNRQGLCDECTKAKTAQDMGHTHRPRPITGLDGWPIG